MLINRVPAVFLLITALLGNSCRQAEKTAKAVTDANGRIISVILSSREIENARITFAATAKQPVDRFIDCYGHLEVPLGNTVHVSVHAGGMLKSIFILPGSYVGAGTLLASLEHIDYVKLQQEFLDTKNQYAYFRDEFKRQGELTIENATSVKKMQVARRDYQTAEIKLNSLRAQLEVLGIRSDSLDVDHLSPLIAIKAPVSGYVTEINTVPGVYLKPGEKLLEITNNSSLYVYLSVPEEHFPSVQKGQTVYFSFARDSLSVHEATVSRILGKIDPLSHTFQVNAGFPKSTGALIPGLSVKAKIKAGTDTIVVVPSDAIIRDRFGEHVFVMNNGAFSPVAVKTGQISGDNIEITGFSTHEGNDSIVIQGGAYLKTLFRE